MTICGITLVWMVLGAGYVRVAYKGCSHITTNLGPHRAQTLWVYIYLFIVLHLQSLHDSTSLVVTNQEPFRPNAQGL